MSEGIRSVAYLVFFFFTPDSFFFDDFSDFFVSDVDAVKRTVTMSWGCGFWDASATKAIWLTKSWMSTI